MSGRTATDRGLDVVPLGGRLGAQIVGDLPPVPDLGPGQVELLKDALGQHKVLVLRGRPLSTTEHRHLIARFGAVAAGTPTGPGDALRRGPSFGRWVAEGSDRLAPPTLVSLRASSPDVAGECTLLSDAAGAYRDLPRPLRALADRSWAVHTPGGADDPGRGEVVVHPVTRLHTETGDRGLMLGGHAQRVLGLTEAESRTVFHLLQSYLTRPHNVLRWVWQPGDVILFDPRAVQHRIRAAAGPEQPTLARLEAGGETPLGIDGQHSHRLATGAAAERRSA